MWSVKHPYFNPSHLGYSIRYWNDIFALWSDWVHKFEVEMILLCFMTKVQILWLNYLSFLIYRKKKSWDFWIFCINYELMAFSPFCLYVWKFIISKMAYLVLVIHLSFMYNLWNKGLTVAALFTKNLTCKISHQVF